MSHPRHLGQYRWPRQSNLLYEGLFEFGEDKALIFETDVRGHVPSDAPVVSDAGRKERLLERVPVTQMRRKG